MSDDKTVEFAGRQYWVDDALYELFQRAGGSPFLVLEALSSTRMAQGDDGTWSLVDEPEDPAYDGDGKGLLPDLGFKCPRCGWTSQHPRDKAEGYCGNCHDWTTQR